METLPILRNHNHDKIIGKFGHDEHGWYAEFPVESKVTNSMMIDSGWDVVESVDGYITKAYIYYLNITE